MLKFDNFNNKHKGDSLVTALVTACMVALIGFSVSKVVGMGISSQARIEGSIHASTYADARLNILKNTPYPSLRPMGKTKISNSANEDYYEEVILENEVNEVPKGRWVVVNIYEGNKITPIGSYRYFVLKDGNLVPRGSIIMWSGESIPDGWHICDGSTVNGFKIPDLRNKFIVGAGSEYDLGSTGGEKNTVMTIAQMPTHNHSGNTTTTKAGEHVHSRGTMNIVGTYSAHQLTDDRSNPSVSGAFGYSSSGWGEPEDGNWSGGRNITFDASRPGAWTGYTSGMLDPSTYKAMGGHSHTMNVSYAGEGKPQENRPPYYAVYYIIKL